MSSNGLPYYRRYARDFLEGTAGMSFEVKCAYSLLLDLIYLHRGVLPDHPQMIAGQLGCSVRKWNAIRSELLAAGKIRTENGAIRNFRADKEQIILSKFRDDQEIKGRKSADNRAEKSYKSLEQNDLGLFPVGVPVGDPVETAEPTITDTESYKEEEGAYTREANSGFSEEVDDPLLRRVIRAVGLAETDPLPRYWLGTQAAVHVRAWITAHGLTEDEIEAEALRSRGRNPEPPDGPKALDRWMAQAGAAKRTASDQQPKAARPDVPAKSEKPATDPTERLRFYADWVNSDRPLFTIAISNSMRDAMLKAGLVTMARLRERGIR